MLKKLAMHQTSGTHCGGLQLPGKYIVSSVITRLDSCHSPPLIQTEILPCLDHAPFLALSEGTTCRTLVVVELWSAKISRKLYHILIAEAEVLDGIDDVWVLLATGVAVGAFHWLPGVRARDEAKAGQHGHEQCEESLHDCGCIVYAHEVLSDLKVDENSSNGRMYR
jgi:hypothetical protein